MFILVTVKWFPLHKEKGRKPYRSSISFPSYNFAPANYLKNFIQFNQITTIYTSVEKKCICCKIWKTTRNNYHNDKIKLRKWNSDSQLLRGAADYDPNYDKIIFAKVGLFTTK